MKHLLFFVFLSALPSLPVNAQSAAVSKRAVREATETEKQRYGLDAGQTRSMEAIQTQRLTNLAAIASLRQQNREQYLAKCRSIRLYVEAATERLLTPQQKEIMARERKERDSRRDSLLTKLKNEGAGREATQLALLALEEEWQ